MEHVLREHNPRKQHPKNKYTRGKLTVQASFIAQEADFTVAVASHETQDDSFLLSALEAVDAA